MHTTRVGLLRPELTLIKGDPYRAPAAQVQNQPVAPAERWDRSGAVRRARRRADLSQRQLAARIGVAAATIARAECDGGSVSLGVIEAILAEGGLRLVVVDIRNEPVPPMRSDAARNHGGRRYPAHLDTRIPTVSDLPLGGWRCDRPTPRLVFHHRFWRDHRRARTWSVPLDHSCEIDLQLARHLRRKRTHWIRPRHFTYVWDPEPCRCGPRCLTYCQQQCRCQCEPVEYSEPTQWLDSQRRS